MYYVPDGTKECGYYECKKCGNRFLSMQTMKRIPCPDCEAEIDYEIGPDESLEPVPRSLNKENQIRLRASSSATRMKSGCSCRMLAGTSGVTGPKKAFLTISALPAPLTTISTLRACMMVRMPMV